MASAWRTLREKLDLVPDYFTSLLAARRNRETFQGIEAFAFFVGYPRSGHSLVGQLLNAHPNAVIAHELNVLRYLKPRFSREQIYALLLERDRWFSQRGREWTGYDYEVPDAWQGEWDELQVIGDKNGGASSNWIAQNPDKLALLRDRVEDPLRVLHVVRNPYDNISTMARVGEGTLEEAVEGYFELAAAADWIRDQLADQDLLDVHHEALIDDPAGVVEEISGFLGLPIVDEHVEACADVVYTSPHKSRHKAEWTDGLLDEVASRMQEHTFLDEYAFEE